LGWVSLLTMLLGMISGPVIARLLPASPVLTDDKVETAAPIAFAPPSVSPVIAGPMSPSLMDIAASGDADAQYSAAWVTIDKDRLKGMKLLRKSANQGHSDAQFLLARNLLEEAETEVEFQEVLSLLEEAASERHGKAVIFLSEIYKRGLGVGRDLEKASRWRDKNFWETREKFRQNVSSVMKFNQQKSIAESEFNQVLLRRNTTGKTGTRNNSSSSQEPGPY
jgi:hypothetical protein